MRRDDALIHRLWHKRKQRRSSFFSLFFASYLLLIPSHIRSAIQSCACLVVQRVRRRVRGSVAGHEKRASASGEREAVERGERGESMVHRLRTLIAQPVCLLLMQRVPRQREYSSREHE